MKSISISQFKLMKVPEIKATGSFNLLADGVLIAIVMVNPQGEKTAQLKAIASQMNASAGLN